MTRFTVLLCLLFAVSFMHADTINLLGSSGDRYSPANVYSFPVGSWYNQYYGTGIGLGLADTYNPQAGYHSELDAESGTTTGYITKFSSSYFYTSSSWQVQLSNAVFNAKTDAFTGTFSWDAKTWHLREAFYPPVNTYNN